MDKLKINEQTQASVEPLLFQPMRGLASPHMQTVFPILFTRGGEAPPSAPFFIPLDDGDTLHCLLSTPSTWTSSKKTIVLIHGLGGSSTSSYMIRLCRKFYKQGFRTLRINLRGTGPGGAIAQKPYHGGSSHDVLQVIEALKKEAPDSPIALVGFSLGGNIALKLVAELGEKADSLLEKTIAICAPIDLAQTTESLSKGINIFYHNYYIQGLKRLGKRWIGKKTIRSISDFDHAVTAPQWGFKDASDYYRQSSSCYLLPKIRHPCHLIFAADDPFVDYRAALKHPLFHSSKIWLSRHGGHMGFWGWAGPEHGYFWLDRFLLELLNETQNKEIRIP